MTPIKTLYKQALKIMAHAHALIIVLVFVFMSPVDDVFCIFIHVKLLVKA